MYAFSLEMSEAVPALRLRVIDDLSRESVCCWTGRYVAYGWLSPHMAGIAVPAVLRKREGEGRTSTP